MHSSRLTLILAVAVGAGAAVGDATAQTAERSALFPNAKMGCSTCESCAFQKGVTQKGVTQKGVTQKGVTQKGVTQKGVWHRGRLQKGVRQKSVPQKGMLQKGCGAPAQKGGGGCSVCINMQPLFSGVTLVSRVVRCKLCGMTNGLSNAFGRFASRGCANCCRSTCGGPSKGEAVFEVPYGTPNYQYQVPAPRAPAPGLAPPGPRPPQPDPFIDDPPTQARYGQSVILRTSRTARPFGGDAITIHVTDR